MKSIMLGNDVSFKWTITRNGEAEDFDTASVEVYLQHQFGKKYDVDSLAIDGNVISGIFRGSAQEKVGVYTLVLTENRGNNNMFTLDHVKFINLVPHSDMEGGTDCSNLITNTVMVTSDISVPSNGIGIKHVVQTTTSTEDSGVNIITVTLDNNSAYTFQVKNGSKGSTGATGATGEKGEKGDKGDTGETGAQGIQGEKGNDGADGADGVVLFPTIRIDASGEIVMDIPDNQDSNNLVIDDDGYLCVNYPSE